MVDGIPDPGMKPGGAGTLWLYEMPAQGRQLKIMNVLGLYYIE